MLCRFYLVHTVALCSPVTRAVEPGGLGGLPIFDLCTDNRLLHSLSRNPPHQIVFLFHRHSPVILCHYVVQVLFSAYCSIGFTSHIVSLCCAGSQDAFHCYGAPLHCCTAHVPALMEVCVHTCMCSLTPSH